MLIQVTEQDVWENENPIHSLFIAVLERALRDLTHSQRHIRVAALGWFETWRSTPKNEVGISYKDIRDALDLSIPRIMWIEEQVDKARLRRNSRRLIC